MYMNTVERHTDLHQKNVPFTSRASNQSPTMTREHIMESSRTSPQSCRMTDQRVDKLLAAKMKRSERKRNPSM
jgi:hypothetical protein